MTRTTKYLTLAGVCLVLMPFVKNNEPLDRIAMKGSAQISPIPAKPAVDTLLYLVGKKEDFQALYGAVNFPDDVTVNQRKQITAWLMSAKVVQQMPDSLQSKPKK